MTPDELKSRRKAMNLKQDGLARLLGIDHNTVSRWELGNVGIPPYLALALKQIEADLNRKLGKRKG
jgi:transcriptional regulator with XRE-family HTH domain